jgi:hypothetical protein
MFIVHDYEKAPLIFEVRGLPEKAGAKGMDKYRGTSIGVVVQYEKGHVLCPNYNDAIAFDNDGNEIQRFNLATVGGDPEKENHFANFQMAMRSRNVDDLNGKILDGHISSALCHTGNISYRVGKKVGPDAIREKIKSNKEAMDSFERLATHLAANNVDLNMEKLTLGEFLKFDPKAEKFIGNKDADALLTRKYRAPFVVPEKV